MFRIGEYFFSFFFYNRSIFFMDCKQLYSNITFVRLFYIRVITIPFSFTYDVSNFSQSLLKIISLIILLQL